jgi:uncharacterized 2Fe-2S/4Fe-4S cluster protein (DUF4445 family)
MKRLVAVTFEPSGAVARVEPGSLVLDAALAAGVLIPAPCGRRGVCGACGVRVLAGTLAPPDDAELAALRRARADVRLACRARVSNSDVSLRPLLVTTVEPARAQETVSDELVAAVDLGTTTVGAAAASANGGHLVATGSVPNAQQVEGADVLSRVSVALAGGSERLQAQARDSVRRALVRVLGAESNRVSRAVIAGNTAMAALLAGADVSSLASHPFGAPRYAQQLPCAWLDDVGGVGEVLLLPPIASFVGGDVLAGLVHAGMLHAKAPELLVDLGTNAEVALARDGRLWVASAPAGPAFEAGGIESGVQTVPGAVIGAEIEDGALIVRTVGDQKPAGIAGSGLIELVAALREAGHLSTDGLMHGEQPPLGARFFVAGDGVRKLRVDDEGAVVLSQLDVRALQLAKAAVATAIRAVLGAAGVSASDLAAVHVAGAFGSALRVASLGALGILPREVVGVSNIAGNASLSGALAMALEPDLIAEAAKRSARAVHVDLVADSGFNRALIENTALAPYGA